MKHHQCRSRGGSDLGVLTITKTEMLGRHSHKVLCIGPLILGISCGCGAQHYEVRQEKRHRAGCGSAWCWKAAQYDRTSHNCTILAVPNSHESRLVYRKGISITVQKLSICIPCQRHQKLDFSNTIARIQKSKPVLNQASCHPT